MRATNESRRERRNATIRRSEVESTCGICEKGCGEVSFFRYPGGKSKLCNQIIGKLKQLAGFDRLEYREPFFGGGSIGSILLSQPNNISRIWINDFDLGISALWTSVIRYPDLLKERVMSFVPSVERFDEYKQLLMSHDLPVFNPNNDDIALVEYGFMKLAIHQISYSGLGTMSGGPLGGREQKSTYPIDCRWSPQYICKKIDKRVRHTATAYSAKLASVSFFRDYAAMAFLRLKSTSKSDTVVQKGGQSICLLRILIATIQTVMSKRVNAPSNPCCHVLDEQTNTRGRFNITTREILFLTIRTAMTSCCSYLFHLPNAPMLSWWRLRRGTNCETFFTIHVLKSMQVERNASILAI